MPFPTPFIQRMQQQLGNDFAAFEQALHTDAPVSIRLNPFKWKEIPPLEPVPWASGAFYLPERPAFTPDPLFHAGAYYVQEASSMFLEQAIRQHLPGREAVIALDLCGAPGGKSTHLTSILPPESLLVSNEVIKSRTNILAENIQKWGSPCNVVSQNDPRDFSRLPRFFDLVVVDAPCSGEGLFRRDPTAANEWSDANVKLCSERQRRILADIWDSLKPGGLLVYSTCTYSPQENEENLTWLRHHYQAEVLPLEVEESWGISEAEIEGVKGYRFYPHKSRGEGFFMAVVRKTAEEGSTERVGGKNKGGKKKKAVFSEAPKAIQNLLQEWVQSSDAWEYVQHNEQLSVLPGRWMPEIEALYQNLRISYAGTPLAEIKQKNLNPLPSLALSTILRPEAHAVVEVDLETAQRFLRREDVLPDGAPEGWVLLQYRGLGLGWIKRIKHRANNYWPKEWRIRMELNPASYQPVI
ncbi:methyltransferase RsmF C-terminal domain-like protein [Nafulsella turpanensis]|uniref:methyltransferase RsmF C-terminal domain-like protein n=1 Tax=Nafulsella turpanensis TaxID=1265690 RepID=UPI0003478012|nr:hypothetical protein [Nafulsella turpanensis]